MNIKIHVIEYFKPKIHLGTHTENLKLKKVLKTKINIIIPLL